ncbi:histidine kinase HHK3 [Boeremia exigua]|uniref:histidine kinase HHK3 n=1 Tax=Boeremia exigua TaxID=749465 RepID=UPI001E8DB47C|nr:histidine kinase HHK3 [Boeremia exigua]KAH6643135.1 histidine kinase HHK3 [Boeremia exigua]
MYFPKADAAVLSSILAPPPSYPDDVGPIFDLNSAQIPCPPWSFETQERNYPSQREAFAPAIIPPNNQLRSAERYLRACLARNERLRLSMFWYHTRDIFKEAEFLSGLQEKVCVAQESIGWECAIVGILDVNFYKRLAAVGTPLGILPRGETLCGHLVTQPPGNVFLLPDMLEDWRFEKSPYVELGGLRAYACAPLRLQNETGDTVCLGTICVASPSRRQPLTKAQQTTLARLADWIVADIVQLTRARRQRERRRMVDMLAAAHAETDNTVSEEYITRLLQKVYPGAVVSLQTCKAGYVDFEGRDPVLLSDFCSHVWEDADYIDGFILKSNHLELPTDTVVRAIAVPCESVLGHSYLIVGSKDFRQVFDDIDAWFVESCAGIVSQMWHKRLLAEVMLAKEKFLRGFSHQLRTPVHGILSAVELLDEDIKARKLESTVLESMASLQTSAIAKTDENYGVYLDTITRAGRDLMSIINSMITLNRWADVAITDRQYAAFTTYELEAELVASVQKLTSGDARYNASVFVYHNLPSDPCNFRTEIALLRDSLLPVVTNAIQSTAEGSVVISISVCLDSKELIVDIEDTGDGIPVHDQERIFELYEQVDPYSAGAGIGLTLASRFAALLKGSIELVSSEVGRGSHFRATFRELEVKYLESSRQYLPAITQSEAIPRHFHVVPSKPNALSLGGLFARSLTCYGFVATNDTKDALIILDYVDDPEEHRAMIAKLPSNEVVLCPVPFPDGERHFDTISTNVVYVHGPFGARTLSAALDRAEKVISLIDQKVVLGAEENLVVLPKLSCNASNDRPQHEDAAWREMPAPSLVTNLGADQSSQATDPMTRFSPFRERELTTSPAEESPDDVTFHSRTTPTNRDADEVQPPQMKGILTDHSPASYPTVLLVDDNAVNLRVLQMYCKKRDLPYVCARDGLEAISVFQSRQERATTERNVPKIQLILMDLQMPQCDGIEATKRIRLLEMEKNWGKSVVFVVTGQDSASDREAAHEAGSQEYHVKPIGIKTLDMALKRYYPRFMAGTGS